MLGLCSESSCSYPGSLPNGRPVIPAVSNMVTCWMIGQKSALVYVVATLQRRTEPGTGNSVPMCS